MGNRLSKVSRPSTRKPKEKAASGEERKVDEATVVEKVSKAIASGEIDDSRVVKDDEDDRESIVEKDQIEEMETSPINHHDKDFAKVGDDDEDAELQRIKDEEEEEDNQERVPDIGPSEDKKEADEAPPRELDLEKAAAPKVAYSHVKTPDEVDDLPEHEVVNPDESMLEEIKSEMSYDLEEKIAKDESEKEVDVAKKDKSEGSIEALKENEEVEVHIEQKLVQAKEENKEEADEDEKDICDNKEEKEVDKLDNEGMNQSDLNQTAAETKDDTQDEKAADSFVNNIYTEEGKQEPCDKVAEENQEEKTKKETKAGDSFINDIYTSEGKQEETDEKKEEETKDEAKDSSEDKQEEDDEKENEKEEDAAEVEKGIFKLKKDLEDEKEQDETNEGTNEEKAAASFVNDVYTSEEKQEQIETIGEIKDHEEAPAPDSSEVNKDEVEVEEEEEETKEEKAADSFV